MPEYKLTRYRGKLAITFNDERGIRRRVSTGTDDHLRAARVLETYKREVGKGKPVTVADLISNRVMALAGRASHPVALHQAKAISAEFGHLAPTSITAASVAAYVKKRQSDGKAASTIRNELSLLNAALHAGVKAGLIEKKPHIDLPQGSKPRDLRLTKKQFEELIAGASAPHVRLFMILAIVTGARAGALLGLTWDRVDFERGVIDLRENTGKRMKGRSVVPMNQTARAALSEAKGRAISPFVIDHGGERITKISKGFSAAAKRAGLQWATPHVLRHSAAVWMAESGVPMAEIAQFLGHENEAVTFKVYARYSPDYLRKAASALEIGSFAPRRTISK